MDARTPIENSRGVIVLSTSFNLNCDCFVVATNSGFLVYDSGTCKQLAKRYLNEGGVGMVQIVGRSNIITLVGGGKKPVRGPKKVVVWDEKKAEFTREITCPTRVRGICVLGRKVVVLLEDEVQIYNVERVPVLETRYPTAANPIGLCSVSRTHIAFPGRTAGQVQLVAHAHTPHQPVSIIPAHASSLGALALSRDGTMLATASEKGTLIRVWATSTNARVAELRRGVDQVSIFSLGFNPSNTMLAATSDKGTLHIFDVPPTSATTASVAGSSTATGDNEWTYADSDAGVSTASDPRALSEGRGDGHGRWGMLGKMPFMPQYFRDTVSFASADFALDDGPGPKWQREAEEAATMWWPRLPRGTLGWTNDDTVVVLGSGVDPKYERFIITTGGEGRRICVRQAWASYLILE